MTCKDCLHVDVCKHYIQRYIGCDVSEETDVCAKNCDMFQNKADMQEVKRGEWIATGWMKETSPRQFQFRCSNCDKEKRQPRGKVWLTISQIKERMDGGNG